MRDKILDRFTEAVKTHIEENLDEAIDSAIEKYIDSNGSDIMERAEQEISDMLSDLVDDVDIEDVTKGLIS